MGSLVKNHFDHINGLRTFILSTAKVDGFVLSVTISVLGKSKGYSIVLIVIQLLQIKIPCLVIINNNYSIISGIFGEIVLSKT